MFRLLSRKVVALSGVAIVLADAAFSHAATVTVDPTFDPGTVISSCTSQLGPYLIPMITGVMVVAVVIAGISWFKKAPRKIAK